MIDNREELINALTEAAELEHGLMLQYLYAAMSLKDHESEGLTPRQLQLVGEWRKSIWTVAKQEMGHLGTVCNLLAAIGGGSHFRRPEFPQPARYYDPMLKFTLEPLTFETIERFIQFEQPETASRSLEIVPDPVKYTTVGNLYLQIERAINMIDEQKLFIGRGAFQDDTNWSFSLRPFPVSGRASATSAIKFIIEEGEGTPSGGSNSHYGRFLQIRTEFNEELAHSPGFTPTRPVISNPKTRLDRDDVGTLISEPGSLVVAELFNAIYSTLILMLMQYYAFNEETELQHNTLRQMSVLMMRNVIDPLGSLLTKLPAETNTNRTAGPGFQFYSDLKKIEEIFIDVLRFLRKKTSRFQLTPLYFDYLAPSLISAVF